MHLLRSRSWQSSLMVDVPRLFFLFRLIEILRVENLHMCDFFFKRSIYELVSQGSQENTCLFEAWMGCSGEWNKSNLVMSIRSRSKKGRFGKRRWMIKKEIVDKFGATAAESIIQRKMDLPEAAKNLEVRRHPECPDAEAGLFMKYYFNNDATCFDACMHAL